jgi:hypothetical protein
MDTYYCEDCGGTFPVAGNDEVVIFVVAKRKDLGMLGKDLSYTIGDLEEDRALKTPTYEPDEYEALLGYYRQIVEACYDKRNQPGETPPSG